MTKKITSLGLSLACLLMAAHPVIGQTDEKETRRSVQITVTTTEDGTTTTEVKEISIDGIENVEELLKELNVLSETELGKVGEELEINIQKSYQGLLKQDFSMQMDFPGEDFDFQWEQNSNKGFLGVTIRDAEEEDKVKEGAVVTSVVAESAADKMGLQEGDIITSVNGKTVTGQETLIELIRANEAGEEIDVTYVRDGKKASNKVELGKNKSANYFKWNGNGNHFPEKFNVKKGAFLGVHIETAEEGDVKGARITTVVDESAAKKMGLEEGDIITAVNGAVVEDHESLVKAVKANKVGEEVEVSYLRDGKKKRAKGELGERSATNMVYWNSENFPEEMEEFQKNMTEHLKKGEKELSRMKFMYSDANTNKAFLGVTTASNDEQNGVTINKVFENSTAQEIGLEEGDIITAVNSKKVTTVQELIESLSDLEPGDDVTVDYIRDGQSKSQTGAIQSREAHNAALSNSFFKVQSSFPNKEINITIKLVDVSKSEAEDLANKAGETFDNELELGEISFSPNPNTGKFNLNFFLSESGDTDVRLLDMQGRPVYEETLKKFEGNYSKQIDIAKQANGVYFLLITQNGKQFTKKVIKE